MTSAQAEETLADAEVEPCVRAPIREAKEILDACLEADIPALIDRGECCGKNGAGCGCAPKLDLLVRPEDAPRVAALMQDRWRAMAEREGVVDEDGRFVIEGATVPDAPPVFAAEHAAGGGAPATEGEHPPCPACGTAAALVSGACSECGLQLE